MFNRLFYSPARSPCSRAALRTIAAALCASGCGWRSATTPKGPSSAVRAAVFRTFIIEGVCPLPAFAGKPPKRAPPPLWGIVLLYVLPMRRACQPQPSGRLHGGTSAAPASCPSLHSLTAYIRKISFIPQQLQIIIVYLLL